MSNMLEQAIIDADALREAALKNAENAVINKYSNQIKEAVEAILEQPEMPDLDMPPEEEDLGMGGAPEVPDMPMAAHDDEDLCGCPDEPGEGEDGVVTIDFDKLTQQLSDTGDFEEDAISTQEMAKEFAGALEEEVDLDSDLLKDLVEELVVDIHPEKSGWAGTPQAMVDLAEEEILALEQDSKVKEEKAAMRKAVKELENVNESLSGDKQELVNKISSLQNDKKELIDTLKEMKDKLEQINHYNAKLLYTNKVLMSDSLNERQKVKVVEALSKAETVEESKIIFETLQSTVGSASNIKQPESLSEAITRPTSTVLLSQRNRETTKKGDPSVDRWKTLAGLSK